MRGARWAVIALALMPAVANAAPEGASADKRMLLYRTAIGRDNCPQARDVTESMLKDFPDDGNVKLMLAQVLACEGKWPEAFVPMMAAKAAGADVAEVEAKILAQVALVDVTVTVDGKASDVALPVVVRTADASWGGVSLGAGQFVFAVPERDVRFSLDDERLPFNGSVAEHTYGRGQRHAVTLALGSVRTVSLVRPAGLGAVTVSANGVVLEDAAREVRVDGDVGREVHFVATWKTPQDTLLTAQWDGDASTPVAPWAHIVRNRDGRIADMGLHRPDETSVVVDVLGAQGETDRVEINKGEKWLQEVSLLGKKPPPVVQVGLEGEWLASNLEYGSQEFGYPSVATSLSTDNGALSPAFRLYGHKHLPDASVDVGGYMRMMAVHSTGVERRNSVINYNVEGVIFVRGRVDGAVSFEGGLSSVIEGVAWATRYVDTTPGAGLGPYAGLRTSGRMGSVMGTVDVRLISPRLFVDNRLDPLDGGPSRALEVEGAIRLPRSPISVRIATRSVDALLAVFYPEHLRAGLDWSF